MKAVLYQLWTNPVLFTAVGTAACTYGAAETTGVVTVLLGLMAVLFALTGRSLVTPNAKLDS